MSDKTASAASGAGWLTRAKRRVLNQKYKPDFILQLPRGARTLDVGCGNNSAQSTKKLRTDLYYVGLDIGDYNQKNHPANHADEYIITSSEMFAEEIEKRAGIFEAVISSHNLEHCERPQQVLSAMCRCLVPGGQLFLSFPSEQSVNFPRRSGTLNFYDDDSHREVPRFMEVMELIQAAGLKIEFSAKHYRPLYKYLKGLLNEPRSAANKRVYNGTWALYGFESIIWARRVS
jgi:SAM-dependent methyltransferase